MGLSSKIYLSYNNQTEAIELPVLPEKLEVVEAGNNKKHILQNIGEITVINACKAPTLKLEGLFPADRSPYVTSNLLKKPVEYINILKKWRDGTKENGFKKQPIRLTVAGTAFPLTIACSIENFSYKETAGAVGDIEYSLDLKEYRWYKVKKPGTYKTANNEEVSTVIEERVVEKEIPKTYTVQSGDSLFKICKAQLGDSSKYKEVAAKNNINNPSLIYPGQVLKLC